MQKRDFEIIGKRLDVLFAEAELEMKNVKKSIEKKYEGFEGASRLNISVTDFFMEAGFGKTSTVKEKFVFYDGLEKMVSCVRRISEAIGEDSVYIGSFIKGEKNYCRWKDIKEFDVYNAMKRRLGNGEILKADISDNIIDLSVECNVRYLSQIMFYFPENNIFIRPDVHCYLCLCAPLSILEKLEQFINEHSDGAYIAEIDIE